MSKFELSIKCHNFFHLAETDWHGTMELRALTE
jgi:hypothetical protein